MSAEHGSPPINSLDIALQSSRQSAADVIRYGSSLFLSQATAVKGIDSDASSQVVSGVKAPGKGVRKSWAEMRQLRDENKRAALEYEEILQKTMDCTLSPRTQELKDKQKRKEAESKLPAAAGGKGIGQRVLGETFCYNRLADISCLVGNYKLSDFTDKMSVNSKVDKVKGSQLFKRFQKIVKENDGGGRFVLSRMNTPLRTNRVACP
jgi:hypothetical protein